MKKTLLDKAITHFGGLHALARAAEVSPQRIANARRRGSVSAELAARIDTASNGQFPRDRLLWGDKKAA